MKQFVIAGYPRTGSSHLLMMLRSHPNILCDAEIFNQSYDIKEYDHDLSKVIDPIAYLSMVRNYWEHSTNKKNVSHFGFKIFIDHARTPPLNNIWEYIQKQELPIILLTRRNLLNRYLSEMLVLSHLSPNCNSWDTLHFHKQVYIDPQKCSDDIYGKLDHEETLKEQFSRSPLFHMAYEDVSPSPESYGRILDFLGLQWSSPIVRFRKQRIKTQRQMIVNYLELKRFFKNSPFLHFFDEESLVTMS